MNRQRRSVSKTFKSNDVFYGNSTTNDASRFMTEAKMMQRKPANELDQAYGSP